MRDLGAQITRARSKSPFADEERLSNFLIDLIHEVCERRGVTPSNPLGEMLYRTIKNLLYFDGILVDVPEESVLAKLTLEEGVLVRATLNRQLRFLGDQDRLLTIWRDKLLYAFSGVLEYFPLSAFTDIDENGIAADDSVVLPEARAYDLCDNLPEAVERLLVTFYDDDVQNAHLFDPLRARFEDNLYLVSGVPREQGRDATNKMVIPTKNKNTSPSTSYKRTCKGRRFFSSSTARCRLPFPSPHDLSTPTLSAVRVTAKRNSCSFSLTTTWCGQWRTIARSW